MPSINKTPNIGLSQWQGNEYIKRQDVVNDNAAVDAAIGNRTIDDTKIPNSDNHTSLSMLLSWLGNMIKSITGKSSWRTAPVKSIEQLNNDIVTHEAEITSLQNEVQNTLARASVSLSNTAPVQSFTADVAGPVDVEFRAPEMVVNLLGRDGGFELDSNSDGLANGWTKYYSAATCTIDTSTYVYGGKSQKLSRSDGSWGALTKIVPSISGHKYYITAYVKANMVAVNNNYLGVNMGSEYANYPNAQPVGYVAINSTSWVKRSLLFTADSNGNMCVQFNLQNAGGVTSIWVDGVILVDLTAIFGSGNEPSQAWCDANISYTNGIQPLINTMVKVSGKNLIRNGNGEYGVDYWGYLSNNPAIAGLNANGYFYKINNTSQEFVQKIKVKSNTTYVLSVKGYSSASNANIKNVRANCIDSDGEFLTYAICDFSTTTIPTKLSSTLLTTDNTVEVWIYGLAQVDTLYFKEVQFEEGSTPTDYEPHKESSIILPGEFCKIGSYADTVKLENGVAKKLAAIKKTVLDGNLVWEYAANATGLKQVGTLLPYTAIQLNNNTILVQKYDGKVLKSTTDAPNADEVYIYTNNKFYMAIANTESGWGNGYNPTPSEIQAYMNGWKMYAYDGGDGSTQYNGTGTKGWCYKNNAGSYVGATATLPTTKAFDKSDHIAFGVRGYATLLYALANPVEELIDTIGSLGCFAGQNTISVETGMVYEKANIVRSVDGNNNYAFNYMNTPSAVPNCPQTRKINKIIDIYINGIVDTNEWTIVTAPTDQLAYGNQRAYILNAVYDPTAEYYVLYQMLPEEYNNQQISLTAYYQQNLLGAHNAIAETVEIVTKNLTLLEEKIKSKWKNWVPALTWATATPTGLSITARYTIKDKICFFTFYVYGTNGNGATSLRISLPQVPKNTIGVIPFDAALRLQDTFSNPMAYVDNTLNNGIQFNSLPTLTIGQIFYLRISGFYEVE